MLKSEIRPRTEYAMRERRTPSTPFQRVRIFEHLRGNKWKAEVAAGRLERGGVWTRGDLKRMGPRSSGNPRHARALRTMVGAAWRDSQKLAPRAGVASVLHLISWTLRDDGRARRSVQPCKNLHDRKKFLRAIHERKI